mmetsp:Transcript_16002/g.55610  ORF Transcript_16002/g.55610 Transcript_16002/m.55610 type:complete len:134 (+) Transcript_16002:62-463(+)
MYQNGHVTVLYDDGDKWKGSGIYVYSLQGPSPSHPAAHGAPRAGGGMAPGVVQATVVQGIVQGQGPPPLPPIPVSEMAMGNEPQCPVCTVNKMDMALQCGHRLCGTCLKGVHATGALCPVCRVSISQVIRCYN